MRGLVMALFSFDFPGSNGALKASHCAGGIGASFLSGTTTTKASTKKTAKTV
ncbi:MAG: hypothetical protein NTV73_01800 [Hyphomicrobiales bacterium]|nr:hypothetical protein [Hyphomicrobiales bacterium]